MTVYEYVKSGPSEDVSYIDLDKVVQYAIVEAPLIEELEAEVDTKIDEEGFEPSGSLVVDSPPNDAGERNVYVQPLILRLRNADVEWARGQGLLREIEKGA